MNGGSDKVLRKLNVWEPIMKISAIAHEIRMAQAVLTKEEWDKVGKVLEELVFEIRQGPLGPPICQISDLNYKSAMWLLGGKK